VQLRIAWTSDLTVACYSRQDVESVFLSILSCHYDNCCCAVRYLRRVSCRYTAVFSKSCRKFGQRFSRGTVANSFVTINYDRFLATLWNFDWPDLFCTRGNALGCTLM